MATKSVTIIEDADTTLKKVKYHGGCLSKVILRLSREKRGTTEKYFGALAGKTEMLRKNGYGRRLAIENEFRIRAAKIGQRKQKF